jgi:uncharacterized membrane protein
MKRFLLPLLFLLQCMVSCTKDGTDTLYFPKIKDIIQQHCMACHAPGGQGMPVVFSTDTDITSRAAAIKSTTLDPVSPANKRMPQTGELSATEKDNILKWFEKGGRATD